MNIEDKRTILKQYGVLKNEDEYAFRRLMDFYKNKYNKVDLKAVNYSHELKPKNDYRRDFTNTIDSVIDEETKLLKKTTKAFKKLDSHERKINEALDRLADNHPDIARVLAFRYLDCYKIREVAEKMNISEDTVKKKQKKGLELIEL